MTLTNFGNNFTIEEDSNGDYVVTYTPTSTVIERIDSGDGEKIFEVGVQISTLKGKTSGATVYDDATQTIGDGTTSADHEAVNTGELNNVRQVDPDTEDWGQAVTDIIAEEGPQTVINTPPGQYVQETGVTVSEADSPIALMGHFRNLNYVENDKVGTTITRTGDFAHITGGGATVVEGFRFEESDGLTGTSPAIHMHDKADLRNCLGWELGGHLIHFEQRPGEGDNMNTSRVHDVSGRYLGGSVVRGTNPADEAPDLNAMLIDVRQAINSAWAVNFDEHFGLGITVGLAQNNSEGAVRFGGERSHAQITHAEIMPVVVQNDGEDNSLECYHTSSISDSMFPGYAKENPPTPVQLGMRFHGAQTFTVGGISVNGSGYQTTEFDAIEAEYNGQDSVQFEQLVSTAATPIHETNEQAHLAVVYGKDQDSAVNQFVDLVAYTAFDAATKIGGHERGSPAGRTYSVSGNTTLELAMDSGTFNVAVKSTDLNVV